MSYSLSFSISLGSSKTGLTLNGQLVDTAGDDSGAAITTGFVEIGTGTYIWTGSISDGFRGLFKIYESGVGGTILAVTSINPEAEEYLLHLHRWFYNITKYDAANDELKIYAENGVDVWATMSATETGSGDTLVQTKGAIEIA